MISESLEHLLFIGFPTIGQFSVHAVCVYLPCYCKLHKLYTLHIRWSFTNYIYKRRGVGGQKNRLFVNFHTIENINGGG